MFNFFFLCLLKERATVFHFPSQSAVLRKLSLVPRQVVATGGGVVVRPINWYTSHGYCNLVPFFIMYKLYIYFSCIKSSLIVFYSRKFMRQGITVFLDVPLDALARRIAAVGTDSRPLLHFDSGDPYTKVAINSIKISKPPH